MKTSNFRNQFLFDELERLIKAEEGALSARNIVISQLLTGAAISSGFLAAISGNAFAPQSYRSDPRDPYVLAALIVFTFLLLVSLLSWLRLLNGAAYLSIIRARRMVIRRELAKVDYCLPGYYSDDINTADGKDLVADQVQGLTSRTRLFFNLFAVMIAFLSAINFFLALYLVIRSQLPAKALISCSASIVMGIVIYCVLFWYFGRLAHQANQKTGRVLGDLRLDAIKPISAINRS